MRSGSRSVIVVSALGAFLCSLDSALNVAFPAISADLGVSARRIALVIVFYHVPIGILTVLGGVLGDRFGHRRVFATGVWICAVAFPLCGFAPDYPWLLAARVVQGAGTGMVYGTAPALVTLGLAPARRGVGLGFLNFAAGAGLAIAPMIAGVLIDAFGWRSVFLFRVPIAVVVGIVALLPLPGMIRAERASSVAPSVSLPLIVGNVIAVAANAASFPIFIFVPYYLVDVVRESATVAGIIFMTVPLSTSLGGLAGGWLTRRFEPRHLVITGLTIEMIGLFAITTLRDGSAIPFTVVTFGLTGFGLGFFQTPNMTLVMAALPDRNQGLAGGMISAMRTIGVLTASLVSPWFFAFRQTAQRAGTAGTSALFLAAFSDTFLACTLLSAAALALAVFVRRRVARRHASS